MRPVLVTSGRHPFEVAMLVAAMISGIALLITDARPRSVTESMPTLVQAFWEVGLVVAGVVGLMGISWRGQMSTSLGVELFGIAVLGTVTTMYTIALYTVSGAAAIAAGAFVGAVALASWSRIWQITRDLRRVARAADAGHTADVTLLIERDKR